ncbi:branched-chain amino acid ABC transporter permease, partial [Actinomadura livida]
MLQQAFNGLVSGAFYALLALGLSIIFGMLHVVNFAHGAFYMLGAFGSYVLLDSFGVSFWLALPLVPIVLGVVGVVLERLFIQRLAPLDPLYNFLFTFGLALILQDLVKRQYGVQSQPYPRPSALSGSIDLGLFTYPAYQVFVLGVSVLVCGAVWVVLTRTRVGMIVRAATERPELTRALGIDVARWVTPVFGFGVALAGLAGVLAAP